MSGDRKADKTNSSLSNVPRKLSDAARRALAEAEARRQAADEAEARAREHSGPDGPEPTRYGDWERKGIVSDF
jgi:hypothetical protein